ncbi:hypothetical protein BDL97_02G167100 [Sphagnum fallax]|nr:hypothetical protein BDL97_02G167100 [Sphagnum fallax]
MGANDSKRISSGAPALDVITTIQRRTAVPQLDPCLERLQQLRVAEPLLKPPSVESSLTDILLQRNTSQSRSFEYELLEMYQEWQHVTAAQVSKKQAELGFQIEGVEAVAMKLLQRLNYSASVIKTSAAYLQDVQGLKVEVCEMKAGLNNVLESYEALCKRVEAQGPDFLQGTPGSALRSGT